MQHSSNLKDWQIELIYLNDKAQYLQTHTFKTNYFSHVFVHEEGKFFSGKTEWLEGPLYVCFSSTADQQLRVNIQANLMIPNLNVLPSKEDGEEVNRAIFSANSQLMQLIREQESFAEDEAKAQNANLRTQSGLKTMLFVEILVCVFLGCIQYLMMKNFVKGMAPV